MNEMANQGIRIVFFADSHLGFDYPLRPRVNKRRRGPDFFDNFQRVLDYATRTKPDLVVQGGDLFFRSLVPPQIVAMAYERLAKFAENGIPILLVPGNHERSKLPRSLWLANPNVHVFDRPKTIKIAASRETMAVSGFPCVRDDVRHRFGALLAECGWESPSKCIKLLCMHQIVEGAQVGPSNYTFRSGKDVVKMSDIPRDCVAVLTGHVHRRQILRKRCEEGGVPVIYPGSIERTSFAEKGEAKGFYEITLSPGETGRWSVHDMNFVELPTRPMVDIVIDPAVSAPGLRAYLRQKTAYLGRNAIVRLTCTTALEASVRNELTAAFLRSVFPLSMTVQLSAALYRDEQEAPGNAKE